LRQRFPVTLAGATLASQQRFGASLSITGRPLRVEISALPKVKLPALLHWDFNHFVVLTAINRGTYIIHDPATGRRVLTAEEVSCHFTGVAVEMLPNERFAPIAAGSRMTLTCFWSALRGWPSTLMQLLALSLALQVAVFAMPFQLQLIVDDALLNRDSNLLVVLAFGFGALAVAQAMIEALRNWYLKVIGSLMIFQVMRNLMAHLVRLPTRYFETRHLGDITSRLGSFQPIQDAMTRGLIVTIVDGVMAIVALAILFAYSAQLALVVLASLALNLCITMALVGPTRRRCEEEIVARAKEQTHVMETMRAIRTIRLMGREDQRQTAWSQHCVDVVNAMTAAGKLQVLQGFAQQALSGLQTVTVIYVGARLVLEQDAFSAGMLIAFLSFRQTLTDRVNSLVGQWFQFGLLRLHLDRLSDIVATEPEWTDAGAAHHDFRGEIKIVNGGFAYGAVECPVLSDVNLTIRQGDYIAITGASGGGKTTLMKMLLGLVPPTAGQILLDNVPATPMLWRNWRENVGFVAQDDALLSGTIADNIAFFDPDMDLQRVHEAATMARVHADILRMPMQYQSLVGDMGSALSGGQRQRILLARALYRRPKVLALDEGTANLDPETEKEIADLIASLPITRIVVAHRPALLERAERTFIVKDGGLTEAPARAAATKLQVAC
jgi:ATP-binding cassette subfamily B protein RaxB